jgi:hypothetical protein
MEKSKLTPEELEDFIRKNKDKFDVYRPKGNHSYKFLVRLQERLHKIYVSIVPHLIKVAISTIIIFAISLFVWNGWIRSDRDQMSLGKVSRDYKKLERFCKSEIKTTKNKLFNVYLKDDLISRRQINKDLKSLDSTYVNLKRELKRNPDDKEIIESMKQYYKIKIDMLNILINNFDTIKNNTIKKSYINVSDSSLSDYGSVEKDRYIRMYYSHELEKTVTDSIEIGTINIKK